MSFFDESHSEKNTFDRDPDPYLTGRILVAMPSMLDDRFAKSVVYLVAHTEDGAMGLVLNRLVDSLTFPELLDQLGIPADPGQGDIRVHFGGPVETGRGFVLHTSDYLQDASLLVDDRIALTASVDILRAMVRGNGPSRAMLALGYAGWGAGQLEAEIQENGWLLAPADDRLLFGDDQAVKWEEAIRNIGIDPARLSGTAGTA